MRKLLSILVAAMFAVSTGTAFAATPEKAGMDKETAEVAKVEKKEVKKAHKAKKVKIAKKAKRVKKSAMKEETK